MHDPRPAPTLLQRLKRAFAASDEIDAERARREAERAGHDNVADIADRAKASLMGVVSSMVIHPRSVAATVEADLFDGTGVVTLIWLGRESIAGVRPGARLEVEGFAARRGGRRVMYNPRYTVLSRPDDEELE
ncbi:OB-fold nucleic acid binding domain-containing protein [Brachybacterium huguangmaarense]